MLFWVIVILVITLWSLRTSDNDECYSRECTSAVNGFFALFILLSHARGFMNAIGYSWFGELGAKYAMYFLMAIGQLCVVSFLFFSGYGVTERIKKVGRDYVREMPKKRILSFYLQSLPVAVLWVVYGAFLSNTSYPTDAICQILFWKGIDCGPCWYNFCIIIMYLIAFVTFSLFSKRMRTAECVLWILAIVYVVTLYTIRPEETWWYNTALLFPLGVSFSLRREVLVPLMKRFYASALTVAALLTLLLGRFCGSSVLHNLYGMAFMLLLLLMMLKIRLGNPVLNWVGSRVFPIYMYHLLFYRLFSKAWCAHLPLSWGGGTRHIARVVCVHRDYRMGA